LSEICSTDGCELEGKYDSQCALHCEKHKYHDDRKSGLLRSFYNSLAIYIFNEIKIYIGNNLIANQVSEPIIPDHMNAKIHELNEIRLFNEIQEQYVELIADTKKENELTELLSSLAINFQGIVFPTRDPRDHYDYFQLFKKLKGVHFDLSTIHFTSFNFPSIKLFFQECKFVDDWYIHSYSILEDVASKTLFQNCTFEGVVSTAPEENSRDVLKIEHHLFNDCEFKEPLLIKRGEITISIFNNSEGYDQVLNYLHITGGEFNSRFILNRVKIKILEIRDVEFKRKFELKESDIQNTTIYNVNFHKLFDAYKTEFNNFKISRSIFNDFTGFEKCQFGIKGGVSDKATEFEYVTFLNFANFRKAAFYNGLDFEHTNLKEPLNFLNAEINDKNTNRETYRIIKHSFDKIGNQIEANRYFSYEMKKYKEELLNEKNTASNDNQKRKVKQELFIYNINEWLSDFGMNYINPLKLMCISSLFYLAFYWGYKANLLYGISPWLDSSLIFLSSSVNSFAKAIPPYGRFLEEGIAFITLIYHIFFLTSTWQFIVAVKRRTKR
jgi:hypothetical protein